MPVQTRQLMGMPVTIEIAGSQAPPEWFEAGFRYFEAVDRRFSTYRTDSEVSAFNAGRLTASGISAELAEVLAISDKTRRQSGGYFDIRRPQGGIDPSGIVKGWAIRNAARLIAALGAADFYVDAGGDVQTSGVNPDGEDWRIGIRNPFNEQEIIMAVAPRGLGIATSGTYARGQHIYNPKAPGVPVTGIVSLTVLGADVLEADRFATAAFAMGEDGIHFLEKTPGLEGCMVTPDAMAIQTTGFGAFAIQ